MNATSCHEEQDFSIKCLPARTSQQRNNGIKAEEQKYKSLHQRAKTRRKCPNKTADGRTLDGAFLLKLHCVDKPSDLCSVHISERNMNSVKPEELREFHNVAFIDASVNSLSLDLLSCFLSLRELNLSLNGLKHMTFCAADFPHLQVLDLSYNSVSAGSVASIGRLPHLKVLHLTGNELHHLPPNMGPSCHDATQLFYGVYGPMPCVVVGYRRSSAEKHAEFPALEVLQLDDNRLTSGVFWSIKNLKRLKTLNLRGNCISEIPYLLLRGSFKPFIDEFEYVFMERNPDDRMKRLSQMCHWEGDRTLSGPCLPLPGLQILNLSDNKITQEEALMAVVVFPAIRELDICSNPINTQRTRDPPSLIQYLQHRLGITVKRKSPPVTKMPFRFADDPKWKVEDRIFKPFLLKGAPRPLWADRRDASIKRKPESSNNKGRNDAEQHPECFFLTQINDVPESEVNLQAEEISPAERKSTQDISVKLREGATLMDTKPIPNLGIQAAVRMLEHQLRKRNAYKDSKPKADVPKPHRRREKRVLSNAKALPPIKPTKQRDQRVEDMMKEIRESTSMSEVPLSKMGVSRQEALLLLRDMKTKYKTLYEKTMEQAGAVQCGGNRAERLSVFNAVCSGATPGC